MLFDPKWSRPSVDGFRAWLERQPPGRRFRYCDWNACAVGQYLISCGTCWSELDAADGALLSELNGFAFLATEGGLGADRKSAITAADVLLEMRLSGV